MDRILVGFIDDNIFSTSWMGEKKCYIPINTDKMQGYFYIEYNKNDSFYHIFYNLDSRSNFMVSGGFEQYTDAQRALRIIIESLYDKSYESLNFFDYICVKGHEYLQLEIEEKRFLYHIEE